MKKLSFIKALWSPFKPFSIRAYFGKTRIGVPYFYPRRWVKATPKLAHKATIEHIKREESYNQMNPNYARVIPQYEKIYEKKLECLYPIPLKVGFSSCGLGYKTKWSDRDYRYEHGPVFSFVFFGYQLAIMVGHKYPDHYWQAWLYYEYNTDKTKSTAERVMQCVTEFPQKATKYSGSKVEKINYYELILKKKYLKYL